MSISNLFVPNDYDLYCRTITSSSGEVIGGDLDVTGNLTVAGTSTLQATSATTLTTSGAATLASASVTGNETVGGTLGVTGASTLHATSVTTLTASGASTLQAVSATTISSSGLASLNGVTATNRMTQLATQTVCSPVTNMAVIETGTDQLDAITAYGAKYWAYSSHNKSHGIAYGFGQTLTVPVDLTINSGGHFQTSDLVIAATSYTLNSGVQKSYLIQATIEYTLDNTEALTLILVSSGAAAPIRTVGNATTNASGITLEYNKVLTGIIDVADTETPTISISATTVTTAGSIGISAASYITIVEL